jgi:cytochrome P450
MTAVQESLASEFDPFGPEFLADPYPLFVRYRNESPVFYSPRLDYWVLTRYHDVRRAFRDTDVYSAANALAPIQARSPRAAAIMTDGRFRSTPTPGRVASPTPRSRRSWSSAWSRSSVSWRFA